MVSDELSRLGDLLERGLISREEFDQQKETLLAQARSQSLPPVSVITDHGVPSEVGAYRINDTVGEGGMGRVYRARHRSKIIAERQGGDVAIKVMHHQYARNKDFQDRFEREASLGLRLQHAGIVKVHDLVVDGGTLALVMEIVDGQPLSELVGSVTGPLPWSRAQPMFQQLLDAVAYAHSEGVVHRDLKPENVLVTPGGLLKILDFGIAKDTASGSTKTGTGMGTVDYMAPEQYLDAKNVDQRADVYALGMTLYEMLAGRLPWEPDTPEFTILDRKREGNLPSPTQFYPDIPPGVVTALMQALHPDRKRRTATPEALGEALRLVTAAEQQRWEQDAPLEGFDPAVLFGMVDEPQPPAAPEAVITADQWDGSKEAFDALDTDGDGVLSREEVAAGLLSTPVAPAAPVAPVGAAAPAVAAPPRPPREFSKRDKLIALVGLVGVLALGLLGWALVEWSERAQSRDEVAEALDSLKQRQTDAQLNEDGSFLEQALAKAEHAFELDETPEARELHALLLALRDEWHKDREFIEHDFSLIDEATQKAVDEKPGGRLAELARALVTSKACRKVGAFDERRAGFCAEAEQRFAKAAEALQGEEDWWLRVEVAWLRAGHFSVRAEESQKDASLSSADQRAAARKYAAKALAVCDTVKADLGRGSVNDPFVMGNCMKLAGKAEDYSEYYRWARQLRAYRVKNDGTLDESVVRKLYRDAGPLHCRKLAFTTNKNKVRTRPKPRSKADRFCVYVGRHALDCPNRAKDMLAESVTTVDWTAPAAAWPGSSSPLSCFLGADEARQSRRGDGKRKKPRVKRAARPVEGNWE